MSTIGPGAETEEVEYWLKRAQQEIACAQRAQSATAVQAHYELAELCLERGSGPIEGDE